MHSSIFYKIQCNVRFDMLLCHTNRALSPTNYQFLMASLAKQSRKNKCAQQLDSNYSLHQRNLFGVEFYAVTVIRLQMHQERLYLHAFAMLLAIQQYHILQGEDLHTQQFYSRYYLTHYSTIKEMSRQEKIVCLEKQMNILEQNQNTINEYRQEIIHKLNKLIDCYLQEDKLYNSFNRQAVQTTFKKIYKLLGYSQRVDEWFRYEQKQQNPNYEHIYQAICEYPSQEKKVIILIYQSRYEQARNQLSKGKKGNFYLHIINFLTLIDLHLFSQMTHILGHFHFKKIQQYVLRQAVNRQKAIHQGQTKEEKVINHLKWIDYYQKGRCYLSMSHAYRSIISMLLQGFPFPNGLNVTQANKEMHILNYYKKLLHSKSKQQLQLCNSYLQVQSYMGRIFSYIIKSVLQQDQPNYSELLQIRQRYFNNALIDALIYICSGDYQKARIQAHCCNLREHAGQQAKIIWKLADLMDKKKYSGIKEVTKEIKSSMDDWIEALVDQIEDKAEKSQHSFMNILNY